METDKLEYYNLYDKIKVFRDYRGKYISVYHPLYFGDGELMLREEESLCTHEKEDLELIKNDSDRIKYLISKGVIIPFKTYSITDILTLGWAVIKNTSNSCC